MTASHSIRSPRIGKHGEESSKLRVWLWPKNGEDFVGEGFWQLRKHGSNDGLSLLSDLILPTGVTLAELGRGHFLLVDQIEVTTVALAMTVICWLDEPGSGVPPRP